jgi:hypothetical protein
MPSNAQYRITGLNFLLEPESILSSSLGHSTVAIKGWPGTHHINPAALHFGETPTFGFYRDQQKMRFGGQVNTFTHFFTGYGAKRFNITGALKHFKVEYSGETAEIITNREEYVANVSGSYTFSNNLSAGVGFNYIYSDPGNFSFAEISNQPEKIISLDLGLHYESRLFTSAKWAGKWSSGWSLTDFGGPVSYNETVPGLPIPMKMNLGSGIQLQTRKQILGMHAFGSKLLLGFSKLMARQENKTEQVGQLPVEVNVPMKPLKALFKSWDRYTWFGPEGEIEANVIQQIWTHTGLEFTLMETLSLRLGYQDGGKPNKVYDFTAIGFGVDLGYLNIDYVHQSLDSGNNNDKRSYWQFTAKIPIKEKRPRSILNYLF